MLPMSTATKVGGEVARAGLRDQQTDLTRERIMEALAAIVVDGGIRDFSVQQVADRAGVSHRTVYRHYPSRDALLEALGGWAESRIAPRGGASLPTSAAELSDLVARNFALFDHDADLVRALTTVEAGARAMVTYRGRRTEAFRDVLARDAAAHLNGDDLDAVTAVVRLLASSRSWLRLHDEHGVDTPRAARTVAWALRALLDDLRTGGGPDPAPPGEPRAATTDKERP